MAHGDCTFDNTNYILVDLPGTYSLMAHSTEEEVARDFICFGNSDATIVVCDGTCLERNLNLALQTIEITPNVIICINLIDEAKKKKIHIDIKKLQDFLGVAVVSASARNGVGLDNLMKTLSTLTTNEQTQVPIKIRYNDNLETAISMIETEIKNKFSLPISSRWLAIKLLDYDANLVSAIYNNLGINLLGDDNISNCVNDARQYLLDRGIEPDKIQDIIISGIVHTAEVACAEAIHLENENYNEFDRKLDKILTSKRFGIPIMILLLLVVFWITITGANYPSQMLSSLLFNIQDRLLALALRINAPYFMYAPLILGIYRVVAWVISVMLPPMAIFFPLFTLLEDFGYLPRIAFNLDKYFKKACACGKQALTMCMGFGCNAAGIVGCRIIDSPRERLIAMITNNFVPCNGRFPTLIAIITMFFIGGASGFGASILSSIILTGVIILSILMTFFVSKLLSKTILKGIPSSFTLELPPYRIPQIGKVIVRSIFDRTLFVLGRAIVVAAPTGLIIWLLANITVQDLSLLSHCAQFLDPFATLLGMDGVILLAFILGFPANEIVVPIIIMAYMATGSLLQLDDMSQLHALLVNNGWTWVTAVSMLLFSLMHWPCSTTCLTIKKESQSFKWTVISFLVPTAFGIVICFLFTSIVRLIGLV